MTNAEIILAGPFVQDHSKVRIVKTMYRTLRKPEVGLAPCVLKPCYELDRAVTQTFVTLRMTQLQRINFSVGFLKCFKDLNKLSFPLNTSLSN